MLLQLKCEWELKCCTRIQCRNVGAYGLLATCSLDSGFLNAEDKERYDKYMEDERLARRSW